MQKKDAVLDNTKAQYSQEWVVSKNKDPEFRRNHKNHALMTEILHDILYDKEKIYDATGCRYEEFHYLLCHYEKAIKNNKDAWMYLDDDDSNLDPGSRCKYEPAYELLLVLLQLKSGAQQTVFGVLVDWSQPTVSRHAKFVINTLYEIMEFTPEKITKQMAATGTIEKLKEWMTSNNVEKILIDGTTIQVPVPKDSHFKTADYSGKTKNHCKNVQVITDQNGCILSVGSIYTGAVHDITLSRSDLNLNTDDVKKSTRLESERNKHANKQYLATIGKILSTIHVESKDKLVAYVDKGYYGIRKDLLGVTTYIPKKKPKNGKLTKEQRAENRRIGKIRVVVEHSISKMKRWYRFKLPYLGSDRDLYTELQVTAGLANMRMKWKIIQSKNPGFFAELERKHNHLKKD